MRPNSFKLCKKAVLRFSHECGPSSLIKSKSKLFIFHSLEIQCAVIPKNRRAFDDVQVSKVKEILPGVACKNYKK